ncbi:MAG: sulfur carrier protein ThiS [Mariniblastus sp.]
MIEITINGEKKSFEKGLSIAQLLAKLELNSRAIAVEVNQELRPRDTHETTEINAGDVLEIVTLVGGG